MKLRNMTIGLFQVPCVGDSDNIFVNPMILDCPIVSSEELQRGYFYSSGRVRRRLLVSERTARENLLALQADEWDCYPHISPMGREVSDAWFDTIMKVCILNMQKV